jgi:mannose-6-phosphate isomerase-like protein (cupin superfamily)
MLISFFIFIVILFLYVHIQEQYKKSEDLEIYEMDYTSNDHLQTVCAMKQPVLFEFFRDEGVKGSPVEKINDVADENAEIKVWDTHDYYTGTTASVDPILLTNRSFTNLAKSDPKGRYFGRWDQDADSDDYEIFKDMDAFFCPKLCANSGYSLLSGASGSKLPLQYHMNDRVFFFVTSGRISVKMTPWRSRKYIDTIKDYENYEFYSRMNAWDPKQIGDKIKWLNFDVNAGHVLYIPPWWWYSIKFSSTDTRVATFKYQTYSNLLAHTVDLGRYYFQFHTTKRVVARTMVINDEEPITNGNTNGQEEGHKESIASTNSV